MTNETPVTIYDKELRDSWLEDGDCSKCRKQKYCSTQCKANQYRTKSYVRDHVMTPIFREMLAHMSKTK